MHYRLLETTIASQVKSAEIGDESKGDGKKIMMSGWLRPICPNRRGHDRWRLGLITSKYKLISKYIGLSHTLI